MKRICCTFAVSALALAALAGCAGTYGPQGLRTGSTLGEVTSALGPPSGRHPRAGGERVEFARGPYGKHTYMLDFDAGGRLIHVEQVLDEAHFSALKVGMPAEQVLRRIGHPSEASYLPRQKHTLWSYRYFNPFCIWFQVSIDTNGHVAELGQNFDPLCERRRFSPGFPF
jgi:hypothetical protein